MVRVIATTFILVTTSFLVLSNLASAQDSTQVNTDLKLPQEESADSTDKQADLEKFRDAFQDVIKQKENQEQKAKTKKKEQDPVLELGGFVLDETRSKLARDFYALFYQNWEAPEGVSNFTITISEQPSFGRGTQINVQIDYEQVYSARLQPKYEYIEAVSEQAVARAHEILKQKAEVRQQLSGF